MINSIFDILVGIFTFFVATAYIPGQNFDPAQGMIYVIGIISLYVFSLSLKPIRQINNHWINACLLLAFINTTCLSASARSNSIQPFLNMFFGISLFYIIANYVKDIKYIINAICLVIVINCLMVILQITGFDPICIGDTGYKNTHMVGLFGFKFTFGAWMSVVAPMLLFSRRWIFGIIAFILCVCSLTWTSIISCFICCMIGVWYLRKKLFVSIIIFGILLLGVIYVTMLRSDIKTLQLPYKIQSRIDTQMKYLPLITSKPLQGYGLGSFHIIGPEIVNHTNSPYGDMVDAWCDYLERAFELGFGILFLIGCLFWDTIKRKRDGVVFYSIIGIPILMSTHSLLNNFSICALFLTLFAMWEIER